MKLTYHYRIKDSTSYKQLNRWARSVNYIWNYCKHISTRSYKEHRRCLSGYDLNHYTAGSGSMLDLPSQTVQAVGEQLSKSAKQHHCIPKYRSTRNSLGWIPFKAKQIKVENGTITIRKRKFRYWDSRPLGGPIKSGCFAQDARGRWYVNIVCDVPDVVKASTTNSVGIDLGMKTQITCSDGTKYQHPNLSKQYAGKLAKAQRAKHTKQTQNINAKIKNTRKDWIHKTTTTIAKQNSTIVVGGVKTKAIQQGKAKGFCRSLYDASWFSVKTALKYKAIRQGGSYEEVNEAYTTQQCNVCGNRTGPKGRSGLVVREWICSKCGSYHDRDINAAINILRLGHQAPGP